MAERTARPLLVLISGAAGSGKTTLARHLAVRLGVLHLERDALWDGLRFSAARSKGASTPHGVRIWYEALALLMTNGVSLVADGTLYRDEDEQNVARIAALGDVVNLHCHSEDHFARFRRRKEADGVRGVELDALIARVVRDQPRSRDALALKCRQLQVDTASGYTPSLNELVAAIQVV